MTKAVKRIVAVTVVILVIFLLGYVWFTGRTLNDSVDLSAYKNAAFTGKDGTMVVFTDENAWYVCDENALLLEIAEYSDGVITMQKKNAVYRFVAIDEETLYDETSGQILTRRTGSG